MSERSKLIKKLDKEFSKFIRFRDNGICYTCNKKQPWKKTDNGHYIRRGLMATRWSEINCHCQCKRCNSWLEGEKDIYRKKLVNQYGEQIIEILEADSRKSVKIGVSEIRVMLAYYEQENKKNGL